MEVIVDGLSVFMCRTQNFSVRENDTFFKHKRGSSSSKYAVRDIDILNEYLEEIFLL